MNIPFAPIGNTIGLGLGPKFLTFTTMPYASSFW